MKEKETKKTNDAGILKLIAFCALLLAAAVWLLEVLNVKADILTFIKEIFLLTVAAVPAYGFVKSYGGRKLKFVYFLILLLITAALVQSNFKLIQI
jgi:uncharacterized protein involved in response to NO